MAVYTDSAHVTAVQSAINAAGYQPALVVDGITGPKTSAGVRWYQAQHGLIVDGLIGDQTMAATISTPPAMAAAGVFVPNSLVPPVISLSVPGAVPAMQPMPQYTPPLARTASTGLAPYVAPTAPPRPGQPPPAPASKVPLWAPPAGGAAVLGMIAAFIPLPFAVPLKMAIGAVFGGLVGGGVSLAMMPKPPATLAAHGEPVFGWEPYPMTRHGHPRFPRTMPKTAYDLDRMYEDLLEKDDTIQAGEIGMWDAGGLKG
jgi:hypothetical protein